MNGWIKLNRKSMNSSVWQSPMIWFVWSWCLLKAAHEKHQFPFNGEDIDIMPGQFITGIFKAVKELPGVSPQNWRTAINYLKSTNRITIKSTNKFSIITIIKWEEYQKDDRLLTNKLTSKLTNHQQTTNKPLTTYNKDNNDNNEKNIYIDSDKSPLLSQSWQLEAMEAIKELKATKSSSIFKCFKDNNQKARIALCDTRELSKEEPDKLNEHYFLKVYNELTKK